MGKECTKFYSEMKETTPGCFNKEGGVFQLVECEFEQKPGCEQNTPEEKKENERILCSSTSRFHFILDWDWE